MMPVACPRRTSGTIIAERAQLGEELDAHLRDLPVVDVANQHAHRAHRAVGAVDGLELGLARAAPGRRLQRLVRPRHADEIAHRPADEELHRHAQLVEGLAQQLVARQPRRLPQRVRRAAVDVEDPTVGPQDGGALVDVVQQRVEAPVLLAQALEVRVAPPPVDDRAIGRANRQRPPLDLVDEEPLHQRMLGQRDLWIDSGGRHAIARLAAAQRRDHLANELVQPRAPAGVG
jgi:hypothetical protein